MHVGVHFFVSHRNYSVMRRNFNCPRVDPREAISEFFFSKVIGTLRPAAAGAIAIANSCEQSRSAFLNERVFHHRRVCPARKDLLDLLVVFPS